MNARRFELRGPHVLIGMLVFFAAVIAVNIAFAVVAVQSFPGEDVRRSYLQGLNYNATLSERRAQAALGWRARAALIETSEGAAVEIVLHDQAGAPLERLIAAGELRRPTDAQFDRTLAFEPRGSGRYVADLGPLPRGRWQLRARAADDAGRTFDFVAELAWQTPR